MNKALLSTSLLLLAASASHAVLADTLSGHVRTTGGQPVPQAVVSDGYSVVQTDSTGFYTMARNDSAQFVFLSVPEAYEMPVDENGSPLLYARIGGTGDFTHDFTLTPFADGGAADRRHVLLAIGDPQVRNPYDLWRLRNETVRDMKELMASYPAGTRFYASASGDLVWDAYKRHPQYKAVCQELGIPMFQAIGNHDHDKNTCGDRAADHYFKDVFGPTYYSFNRGNIHYVVLDDIDYIGCRSKNYQESITPNQLRWLERDLSFVPRGKAIVIIAHAPFEGTTVGNRQQVYNLLTPRYPKHHIITGHQHIVANREIYPNLYDHTLGTSWGASWSSDYSVDGTPNGYGVFEAGDTGFENWYYKSTGRPRDFQINAYPAEGVDAGDGKTHCIVANVWNYDSRWSVSIYENGVKHPMTRYTGTDPMVHDLLGERGDTRPNYPGSDGGTRASQNPGAIPTDHLFCYVPGDPDAHFVVEATDRFGHVYRSEPVLRNMMVASFTREGDTWTYRNDFDALPRFANHFVKDTKLAKGTFVQGHTPAGWYASALGGASGWGQFNYLRINNGDQSEGGLYSYGSGDTQRQVEQEADRAFGSLATDSLPAVCFGVAIENNTGDTLRALQVSYTGEMWRAGHHPKRTQTLAFACTTLPHHRDLRDRRVWIGELPGMTDVPALDFHSPADNTAARQRLHDTPIDGNDPRNRTDVQGIIPVRLAPGEVAILRWSNRHAQGHGLAIDHLSIKAIK